MRTKQLGKGRSNKYPLLFSPDIIAEHLMNNSVFHQLTQTEFCHSAEPQNLSSCRCINSLTSYSQYFHYFCWIHAHKLHADLVVNCVL